MNCCANGATTASIVRLVLGQGLRVVATGIVLGLIVSAALSRLVQDLLYDTPPLDPLTYAGTALVLLAVATAATLAPALRSTRIAPVQALRAD